MPSLLTIHPIYPIHTFLTHRRTHADENDTIWESRKFGEKKFPGISKAKIIFDGAGGEQYMGCLAKDLLNEGVLPIGVGGGIFDEHPGIGIARKKDECTATLMAKYLEIENDLALTQNLRFVKNSDLHANGSPFDLAQLIKANNHAFPDQAEENINWSMIAFEANYQEQKNFATAIEQVHREANQLLKKAYETLISRHMGTENDPMLSQITRFVKRSTSQNSFEFLGLIKSIHHVFSSQKEENFDWIMRPMEAKYQEQKSFIEATEQIRKEAIKEEVAGFGGKKLVIMTIVSDNEKINAAARKEDAAVVIQKKSTDNVQIYTNQRFQVNLYTVAGMIRCEERMIKGLPRLTDYDELEQEGKVRGAEEWYFQYAGQMLLNGSLSVPNVLPTKISLERIREIVKYGISV